MQTLFESFFMGEGSGLDEVQRSLQEHDNKEMTDNYISIILSFRDDGNWGDDPTALLDRILYYILQKDDATFRYIVKDYSEKEYFVNYFTNIFGYTDFPIESGIQYINNFIQSHDSSVNGPAEDMVDDGDERIMEKDEIENLSPLENHSTDDVISKDNFSVHAYDITIHIDRDLVKHGHAKLLATEEGFAPKEYGGIAYQDDNDFMVWSNVIEDDYWWGSTPAEAIANMVNSIH